MFQKQSIKYEQDGEFFMGNEREHILKFRVNDEELAVIMRKVKLAKCRSTSDFLRQNALSGRIIMIDTSALKETKKLVSSISQNINQIALRINYQSTIYKDDIDEMQNKIEQIIYSISEIEKALNILKDGDH